MFSTTQQEVFVYQTHSKRVLCRALIGVIGITATLCNALAADPSPKEIRWIQVASLSPSSAAAAHDLLAGSKLVFDEVNASGGIFGRRIELEQIDGGEDPKSVAEAMGKVAQRDDVFGVYSMLGTVETATAARMLPGWPIFTPTTGANQLRSQMPPNVLFARATWGEEIDGLLGVASRLGLNKMALVYPEGPVGQAIMALADTALTKHKGLTLVTRATIPSPFSMEVAPAVRVIASNPDVQFVLIAIAGPAAEFILQARNAGLAVPMYAPSTSISPEFFNRLKGRSAGIGFGSPIPSPWDRSVAIARDYQDAWLKSGKSRNTFSFASFEGYINARLMMEALKRVGPDLTRQRFIQSAKRLKFVDYGGLAIDWTKSNTAMNYKEVFAVSSTGRVMR
jgi:branched-chain amino acid transport system substrate-binding protein